MDGAVGQMQNQIDRFGFACSSYRLFLTAFLPIDLVSCKKEKDPSAIAVGSLVSVRQPICRADTSLGT